MKGDYLHIGSEQFILWKERSDSEVWTSFLKGNKTAFEYIYQKYVDELFSYGMNIRSNRSLIKDSIQDLFIDLWNRRKYLSVTDNIKFYLFRSLRRKIKHLIERDKKLYDEHPLENLSFVEIVFPFEQKLIAQQANDERKMKIKRSLLRLPERQREVINLIFFEQLSYEEVSEILSINIKSVYTLTWKAVTSLKRNILIISFLLFVSLM